MVLQDLKQSSSENKARLPGRLKSGARTAAGKAGNKTSRVQPCWAGAGEGAPGPEEDHSATPGGRKSSPNLDPSTSQTETQSELGGIAYRKPGGYRKTYGSERAATGPRLRGATRQGQTWSLGP